MRSDELAVTSSVRSVLFLSVLVVAYPAFDGPVTIFVIGLTTGMSNNCEGMTSPADRIIKRPVNVFWGRGKTNVWNKVGLVVGIHVVACFAPGTKT